MDNIQNEPLRQKAVHELLLRKQNDDYPLADWYLGALYALNSYHNPDRLSQAAQSIRELLEKLPRISSAEDVPSHTGYALKQKREKLDARLRKDKELVEGAWKGKLISSHMDETLRELEKYLEWNRRPRSSEVSFKSISDTDPMAGVFSKEIVKRKRQRFIDTWQKLQNYAHHKSKISEENIKEVITICEEIILEAFALATAEDQSEIHNIITSENPTESDMQKISQLINKKGANYVYFWNNLSSSQWFPFLKKHGYFKSPPNIESAGDGYIKTPTWHPLKYLSKILNDCPDDVIELICNLN